LKFEEVCGESLKSGALTIYKIDYSLFRIQANRRGDQRQFPKSHCSDFYPAK
jgi:hypothetical protein